MSDVHRLSGVIKWWATIVVGTLAALLIAWLGHIAGVSPSTILSIGAGAAALAWLIVLVAVPWNLYFGARRVVMEMAVSRARGIEIQPAQQAEARTIARRMLWFALGGHVTTAEDVVALRERVAGLVKTAKGLEAELAESRRALFGDLRRTEEKLADGIAHGRQVLTGDLARLRDAHAADREAARQRDDELGRRIDTMIRRIDETLTGLGDQQELLAGLGALVRMVRAEPASPG